MVLTVYRHTCSGVQTVTLIFPQHFHILVPKDLIFYILALLFPASGHFLSYVSFLLAIDALVKTV